MRATALVIRTPDGVVFSQPLAGPVIRFCAWLVDLLCIQLGISILSFFFGLLGLFSFNLAAVAMILGYFVISIGYGMLLEWIWRGQTIGKRLFRLRVVDAEGMRLQAGQIILRNLLRCVDSLPLCYVLGGATCWLSQRCQRIGDIAGNTVVVRIPMTFKPDLDQIISGKFNSLRQHPHLAARLRQAVSPTEASVAVRALLRREELDPVARVQLYADLASYFQSKVKFPADCLEGMADEHYLRNLVEILYRPEEGGRSPSDSSANSAPARIGAIR